MSAFNPGGVSVSVNTGAQTITLDGVGDVVKAWPNTNGGSISVNGVGGAVNESVYVRIPLDATTVETTGSGGRLIRGTME